MVELGRVWVVKDGSRLLSGRLLYDAEHSRYAVVDSSGATVVEGTASSEDDVPTHVYRSRREARGKILAWLKLQVAVQEERIAELKQELATAQEKLTELRTEIGDLEAEEWEEGE